MTEKHFIFIYKNLNNSTHIESRRTMFSSQKKNGWWLDGSIGLLFEKTNFENIFDTHFKAMRLKHCDLFIYFFQKLAIK